MSTEDFGSLPAVYQCGVPNNQRPRMALIVLISILVSLIGRPIGLGAQQPPLIAYVGADTVPPAGTTTGVFSITPNGLGNKQIPASFQNLTLVNLGQPKWSRDGLLIAAEAVSSADPKALPQVFVFDRNGSNTQQVTNISIDIFSPPTGVESLYSAFSPDRKRMAVDARYFIESCDNSIPPNCSVSHSLTLLTYTLGTTGWTLSAILLGQSVQCCGGFGVDWSPKTDFLIAPLETVEFCPPGSFVSVVSATELFSVTPSLSPTVKQITNFSEAICANAGLIPTYNVLPAFSPDGTKVAYVQWQDASLVGGGFQSTIRMANLDGTGDHAVIPPIANARTLGVSWSPDGTQLTYDQVPVVSGIPNLQQDAVSIIKADGTGVPRLLVAAPAGQPAWSPGITANDFDGDGKADVGVFRPSSGNWFIIPSSSPGNFTIQQWGMQGDIPVPGDYDGDGKTDFAVWRPSTGTWFIIPSSKPSAPIIQQWGTQGDIPVSGDYYGDGKTDIAVLRPSSGTWFIFPSIGSTNSPIIRQWGTTGDIPVPGDYDGDGITDTAVFRPSTGTWFIMPSSNSGAPIIQQWGTQGDIPVLGDYYGDGKTDIAVWRPSSGTWFIFPSIGSTNSPIVRQWGTLGDIPVPRDYDDDGKTDFAVWRPSTGIWYIIPSSAPTTFTVTQWGTNGDVPVQKPVGQ